MKSSPNKHSVIWEGPQQIASFNPNFVPELRILKYCYAAIFELRKLQFFSYRRYIKVGSGRKKGAIRIIYDRVRSWAKAHRHICKYLENSDL